MTEKEIVAGILARDESLTREFLFGGGGVSCKGLLTNVLKAVYHRPVVSGRFTTSVPHVVYEDAAAAFYEHLMREDGKKLRSYDLSRNRFYGWLRTCAVNFFIDEMRKDLHPAGADTEGDPPVEGFENIIPIKRDAAAEAAEAIRRSSEEESDAGGMDTDFLERALSMLSSSRAEEVLRRTWLLDEEPADVARDIGVTTANLYNIRSRAWREYVRIAKGLIREGETGHERRT